ncbi:hypothetical protein [Enterococcus sp. DIV1059_2]|uniref:hypothetical protein n=1 Tax=Enterococcus sp. DIV1059_2 TaxID=2774664 RepID=UPI003F1F0F99
MSFAQNNTRTGYNTNQNVAGQGYGSQQSQLQALSIRSTKPGDIGPEWYMTDQFDGAHLVTNYSSNDKLHIDSIFLQPANNPNRPKSVARVTITMAGGLVRTGGWINQTDEGALRFSPYQSEYLDESGAKNYSSPVILNKLVAAQILRYAHKLIVPFDPSMIARPNNGQTQNQAQHQFQGQAQPQGNFQGQAQSQAQNNFGQGQPANNFGNQFGNSTIDISDDDLPF